uniref:Uncharacterized protein n=1 Tax=Oryza glumipatula TaxID=40148 RepID=A0A0E0BET5_9ORYZ
MLAAWLRWHSLYRTTLLFSFLPAAAAAAAAVLPFAYGLAADRYHTSPPASVDVRWRGEEEKGRKKRGMEKLWYHGFGWYVLIWRRREEMSKSLSFSLFFLFFERRFLFFILSC